MYRYQVPGTYLCIKLSLIVSTNRLNRLQKLIITDFHIHDFYFVVNILCKMYSVEKMQSEKEKLILIVTISIVFENSSKMDYNDKIY